jgi:hypothetical protein
VNAAGDIAFAGDELQLAEPADQRIEPGRGLFHPRPSLLSRPLARNSAVLWRKRQKKYRLIRLKYQGTTEIRTVTTLRSKREEIQASIKLYEDRIKQARADLAHVTACIKIFEASGDPEDMPSYVDVYRLFARGEQIALCKQALENGPQSTRELALHVMAQKGLDTGDKALAKAVAAQLIHSLRMPANRGKILRVGKKGTALL